ncbi:MAG: type III pantothenate kinase [Verrucomicrobia bacterium]|nr:type III pantothenate kinase [Verrucomicrobiota bacterium]
MSTGTPFLVADLSNSFVKLALTDGASIISEKRKVITAGLTLETLEQVVGDWKVGRAVLASVVPEKARVFADYFGQRLQVIDHTWDLGIGIEFTDPSRIGGDRLANSTALAELYGYPGVVIDFGTAVTFDIIDARSSYIGGVIAPGLAAMTDYLHEKTALLPRIELRTPETVICYASEGAMLAGAYYGYQGLVRSILAEIRATVSVGETDENRLRVVATGGYAELLLPGIPEIDEVNPNITLEGVRIAGRNRNPH